MSDNSGRKLAGLIAICCYWSLSMKKTMVGVKKTMVDVKKTMVECEKDNGGCE